MADSHTKRWMLYGAYGYTGALVAEEAVKRGHRPVLAGRSERKLVPLAERLGLEHAALTLEDTAALAKAVAEVDLVFHAAGPFAQTGAPMLRACLAAGAGYVDITGEMPVLQNTFLFDEAARQKEIVLLSGAGFDIIPTDCLSRYVADQVAGAVELEVAIEAIARASAGTAQSTFEILSNGGFVRRDGKLTPYPLGKGRKKVRFSHGKTRTVVVIPWADLETAYRSTAIPNITTYMAFPPGMASLLRVSGPVIELLLSLRPLRRLGQIVADKTFTGPRERLRQTGKSYVWARATDGKGRVAQAWLETPEAYRFTALGGVRCVEKIFEQRPVGALTPAQAFGADFVLEIEGVRRFDRLES